MPRLTPEQVKIFKDNAAVWQCPKGHNFKLLNVSWCGKNLLCNQCGEHYYYKEYKVVN